MLVKNNTTGHRYELTDNGDCVAFIAYSLKDHTVIFTHTEVVPEKEGQGYASMLAREALDDAQREGLRIVPTCPFVARYIERHPKYQALVHSPSS